MLKKLSSKKELRILGINSGTSADGVDLALIKFTPGGKKLKISFIDGKMFPYPRRIKTELDRAIEDKAINLDELSRLDTAFGNYLGLAALRFAEKTRHRVDLIASHGQTIGHYSKKEKTLGHKTGTTLQIGDGNAIAAASGLPVVSDFRRADIALGGEGAPLTPFVNHLLFGHRTKSRIIVNIGGIANFSYHPAGAIPDNVKGGDCGPGNVLSDLICRLMFHTKFDRNGTFARKGTIHKELINPIIEANKGRGVSAGREQFDQYLLARLVHTARRLKACKHDILASSDDAVAILICWSIAGYVKDPHLECIHLTGGGRHNRFIVERLQKHCRSIPVRPIEDLGYDGDFLEALSFAVLGGCFIAGRASTMPHITGSKSGGVAGKLSLPPVR